MAEVAAASSGAAGPDGDGRQAMVESTLWKENVLTSGHRSVWGSLYDKETKRWGYACCKGFDREAACTVPKDPEEERAQWGDAAALVPEVEPHSPGAEDDWSTDSEHKLCNQSEQKPIDFSDPPAELRPRAEMKNAREYIEHFVRYTIGEWERQKTAGFPGFNDHNRGLYKDSLPDTVKAIGPLIWRLKKGENLDRGEKRNNKRSRETRTSMEGKYVREQNVLDSLERMTTCAADREYSKAHETYMRLTFGNKMWNLTHVAHVAACTMKGAREYRRNRDSLNTYDMDPVSQKYMHAIKKLVNFTQCLRPNDDESKNVVI
eukprot:TRINITY_DN48699_c0_g1_i2.p2 TRINITY_DN48699_c0_g1~~TRINITY_DN48699_c0_g1_i2.p2  ORF type:complete len:319 (-),score=65.28 TRINITY_DN48699_c0_g1_i2:53-1009(-)